MRNQIDVTAYKGPHVVLPLCLLVSRDEASNAYLYVLWIWLECGRQVLLTYLDDDVNDMFQVTIITRICVLDVLRIVEDSGLEQ